MKKYVFVANWKMHPTDEGTARKLARDVEAGLKNATQADVVLCPPFVYLAAVKEELRQATLGAQNGFWEREGAFTGEISPAMLEHIGCEYVILGHSERKDVLGETYQMINRKMIAAVEAKLTPVLCVGEKEKQTQNPTKEIETQMREILKAISQKDMSNIVLAYEPEWAISTNPNAKPETPEDCNLAIESMRSVLKTLYDDKIASSTRILYGGSVDSSNIAGFLAAGSAQGALVGSASLKAGEFIKLIKTSGSGK